MSGTDGTRREGLARRVLLSLLVLGLVGVAAGFGTYAAFSSTTSNPGNSFAAGTVYLSDNDSGSSVVSLSGARPGDSSTGCIVVTYGGSLTSNVRLYASVGGGLAPYLTLTVTRGGSGSGFPSCASFGADGTNYAGSGAGVVYSGSLSGFPSSYGAGIVDPTDCGSPPCAAEDWVSGEPHAFRFSITLQNDDAAQGLLGSATFTWEARNT